MLEPNCGLASQVDDPVLVQGLSPHAYVHAYVCVRAQKAAAHTSTLMHACTLRTYALRPIAVGEHFTMDYATFGTSPWYEELMNVSRWREGGDEVGVVMTRVTTTHRLNAR